MVILTAEARLAKENIAMKAFPNIFDETYRV